MAKHSRRMQLGSAAPDFSLPDAAGRVHSRDQIAAGRPLLVAFICNHCPFVKHVAPGLAAFAREYQPQGLAIVAISSNDIVSHPDDAPPKMVEFARQHGFTFPYLYDETQQVALTYEAVCTPDFFLFDGLGRLAYRGQFDGSRPHTEWDVRLAKPRNAVANDGADMRAAADAVLAGRLPEKQVASAGCSIKWKPRNEPDWA